jgi:hypothetical protein
MFRFTHHPHTHMKATFLAATAVVPVILTLGAHAQTSVTDPIRPKGGVTASPQLVRTGTFPNITWTIAHPQVMTQVAQRDPDGTLVPSQDCYIDVRVLGVSNTASSGALLPVEVDKRTDGANSYSQIFLGDASQVEPGTVIWSELTKTGRPIDIRVRDFNGTSWDPFRSTESWTVNVVALIDGEKPPSANSSFKGGSLQPFLKPYLDSEGRVLIGPMDVIYLVETRTTTTSDPSYNLQDVVILVTLRGKNNNGHGNNLDGVDISNPGQGGGGPNGSVDTSAPVDDEKPK